MWGGKESEFHSVVFFVIIKLLNHENGFAIFPLAEIYEIAMLTYKDQEQHAHENLLYNPKVSLSSEGLPPESPSFDGVNMPRWEGLR
jgi:hypothetical protein